MKFKYNDPIKVVEGFYDGLEGNVFEYIEGFCSPKYSVKLTMVPGYKSFFEEELVLDEDELKRRGSNCSLRMIH